MTSGATVRALRYYPIKACGGVTAERAHVTEAGLEHDRTFTVVNADGVCLTQREHRTMAAIRVAVTNEHLTVRHPAAGTLTLAVRRDGTRIPVTVFKHIGHGIDQGDEVAEWFATVLGEPCRLARVPQDHRRQTSGLHRGTAGFADGHAVTVASLASLDELTARILERGGEPVPMDRFRVNIVLDGWRRPHTEDDVRTMSIGTARFGYAKRDIRCQVTTIDQDSGEKPGPEPLRTLATYRRDADGGVAFAMKAAVTQPGDIAVGDVVDVHEWELGHSASAP
ncbi:MOSC domain-containing protein [Haloechinothrix halophila]|uniref:MOSC domain-containing protein n=1 Tax=Haloechinothrix halophila TaxID=1069073 RepID=UPI0005575B93|nr:MOSC N-terminal beta barrel domain-containing protein [Haloechinothrix halophila]